MVKKNFYELLQVAQTADSKVIVAAYNNLLRRLYQGVSPYDLNDIAIATLKRAYEVLSDPAKRAGYDVALANLAVDEPQVNIIPPIVKNPYVANAA